MRRLRIWRHRLRSIFSKEKEDGGLGRELAFHVDQLVRENLAAGVPPSQARAAALRAFGNVPLLAEECRDQRRVGWLHDLRHDIEYGWRLLRANRRFSLVAVASLALGIGANTAILGALQAALRGELPLPDSDRLVLIRGYTRPGQTSHATVPEYLAFKERLRSFSAVGMSIANRQDLTNAGDGMAPERLTGQAVTPSLFRALAVAPLLGRTFSEQESPGREVVLSHRLWMRRFTGDRAILNRRLEMDGQPWTVVGVMPPGFWYPNEESEYWVPLAPTQEQREASERLFAITARLREGVSPRQAQAELDAAAAQLAREFPLRQRGWRARLVFPSELWFGWLLLPLAILEATSALVLLIACANLGALLLSRAAARRAEFAMRTTLGASRSRLVRQLFAEALLLAVLGGIASIAVSWVCVRLLTFLQPPPGGAHPGSLTLGAPVLAITVLLSVASGLAAGAAPVLWQWRRGPSLRESAEGGGETAWRGALVTVQISLALMLLIASGLLAKSLVRVVSNDRGFDVDGLLTLDFRISPRQYLRPGGSYHGMPVGEARSTAAVVKRVYDRLRAVPGVEAVAAVSSPPVNALVVPVLPVLVAGQPLPSTPAEREAVSALHLRMTPGYLRTVRAHLIRGRDITEADTAAAPWIAVVNESMARRFWPGEEALGQSFVFDVASGERPRTVVGVVRDMAQILGGTGIRAVVYTSYVQQPEHYRGAFANQFGQMTFVLRGPADPAQLIPSVRSAIAEVEPGRTISNVMPLVRWGGFGTINRGMNTAAVAGFAVVATLLACLGVYGVTAYSISQRTREIGIRLALGGQWSEIVQLLCAQAVHLIGIGMVLGSGGAWALTRFLASELPQVSPHDPAIFAGANLLLALVAFAASLAPARAVRTISVTTALRAE